MKSRNPILGLLVIFIGVVALLATFGVFTFHWSILLKLWPLILIIIGASLLPLNNLLRAILLLVTFGAGCVLYHVENKKYVDPAERIERFLGHDQQFSEPYRDLEKASIEIEVGACDLTLQGPCAELVQADIQSSFVKYSLRTEHGENDAALYLTGRGHTRRLRRLNANDVKIALCDRNPWDFKLEMGAADAELDFSPYRMENIEIKGGACDIDMKLGDSGCDTRVDISTGVSDIEIEVPMGVDCEIQVESAITEKDFEGFERTETGCWRTPNFGQGDHCITLHLNCAISDISVKRY